MKNQITGLLLFFLFFVVGCDSDTKQAGDTNFPCKDGKANELYACNDIDLHAVVSPTELGGTNLNDIWGWTDPQTNKEYALVGLLDGVSFVDITDPNNPVVIGKLDESDVSASYAKAVIPANAYETCFEGIGQTEYAKKVQQGSIWRDHKVYNNHLYIVSDAQLHGVQIFDLTKLRQFSGTFINFTDDGVYDGLGNAHNIIINEQTGFAYVVGSTVADTCATAGLHMLNLANPKQPAFVGCYEDTAPPRRQAGSAYIHDAQCVIYNGPDTEHSGKEVCFNAAERSIAIADVSDKENPLTLGFQESPNMYYAHQGWLTDDQSYFLMNDELDEYNLGRTTKTYVFDVRDLDNPEFVGFYEHNTQAIDHNLYIKGDYVYATNYISGLRVLRLNDVSTADLSLAAFFDTEPSNFQQPNQEFEGAWSSYPYFESGTIAVSDINRGLFLLKPNLD